MAHYTDFKSPFPQEGGLGTWFANPLGDSLVAPGLNLNFPAKGDGSWPSEIWSSIKLWLILLSHCALKSTPLQIFVRHYNETVQDLDNTEREFSHYVVVYIVWKLLHVHVVLIMASQQYWPISLHEPRLEHSTDKQLFTWLDLMMTSAQVVETSVTDNSPSQDYPHPDNQSTWSTPTPEIYFCTFYH